MDYFFLTENRKLVHSFGARKKVILAAGIESTKILQLAGIGPRDLLESNGIKPSRAIYYSEKNKVYLIRMSSLRDIQKVINFFSFENHYPLIGYKKDSYETWLKALKESSRYKGLIFP